MKDQFAYFSVLVVCVAAGLLLTLVAVSRSLGLV